MRLRKTVINKVGKYEIGKTIGEDTFAEVKFALNTKTGESVAMKVLDQGAILKHKMVDRDTKVGEEGFVETNQLGQVKIASTEKTWKRIWVNAKQYRGILRRRLARLKWEQIGRKLFQRNKINKSSKNKEEPIIYNPTSTPLTWSSDL